MRQLNYGVHNQRGCMGMKIPNILVCNKESYASGSNCLIVTALLCVLAITKKIELTF